MNYSTGLAKLQGAMRISRWNPNGQLRAGSLVPNSFQDYLCWAENDLERWAQKNYPRMREK